MMDNWERESGWGCQEETKTCVEEGWQNPVIKERVAPQCLLHIYSAPQHDPQPNGSRSCCLRYI
jgi:hypothetical protein